MHHKWRIVKWLSLGISLGSILIAVAFIWLAGPTEVTTAASNDKEPLTRVESPVIVERKDGKVLWQLRAEQAKQQLDGKLLLIKPRLELTTEGKRKIPIKSEQAWFDPIRRNIRFEGNVSVHYEAWKILSEQLLYNSAKDEISIPGDFSFKGNTMRGHGKQMRLHRPTDRLNVTDGIWIEDSDPRWQGANT